MNLFNGLLLVKTVTFKRFTGVSVSLSFLIFRSWMYDAKVDRFTCLFNMISTPTLPEGETKWIALKHWKKLSCKRFSTHSSHVHRAPCFCRDGYTVSLKYLEQFDLSWARECVIRFVIQIKPLSFSQKKFHRVKSEIHKTLMIYMLL